MHEKISKEQARQTKRFESIFLRERIIQRTYFDYQRYPEHETIFPRTSPLSAMPIKLFIPSVPEGVYKSSV